VKLEESDILNIAGSHPLLKCLEVRTLQQVVRSSKLVHYRAKRTILKEGERPEHIFCLLSGAVRVFHRQADGNEILVKLFRAPAIFGEMEVLAEIPFIEYVTTLESTDILLVPAQYFRDLVRGNTELSRVLVFDLAARLCVASDHQRALAFCDTDKRLANLLLDYAQLAGTNESGLVRLGISLSQDAMARDLGVSRKAIAIALTKLRKLGIVGKENARYVIKDMAALAARSTQTLGLFHRIGQTIQEVTRPKAQSAAPVKAPERTDEPG
jgi:CRP/FNR family transcriptional regulator, cyclic AMP receptor protein